MPATRLKPAPLLLSGTSPPPALVSLLLASLPSPHTRKSYAASIDQLYAFKGPRTLTPALLVEWRAALAASRSAATVNTRLCAARKLFEEARAHGFLPEADAAPLLRVRGLYQTGVRVGNWLTAPQARALLTVPDRATLAGKRDRCILAIELGCALRVSELATLDVPTLQQRDGRWVLADILSKRHRRTVAVPVWVMRAVREWLTASGIVSGRLLQRATNAEAALGPQGILGLVRKHALKIGLRGIGPHDLRRTCARLMYAKGETLDQIRMMLGHQSLTTTQRYLGSLQDLRHAPNDDLGIE